MALLVALLQGALGTHNAFGSYYWWRPDPNQINDNVLFTAEQAWRRNYPWSNMGQCSSVVGGGQMGTYCSSCVPVSGCGSICLANPGTQIPIVGAGINMGQMSFTSASNTVVKVNLNFVVYSKVDLLNDCNGWFYGAHNQSVTLAAAQAPWTMNWGVCCRLSTLRESNNDQEANVAVKITNTAIRARGPRTTGSPRIYVAVNLPIVVTIPGSIYTGATLLPSMVTAATYTSGLYTNPPAGGTNGAGSGMRVSGTVVGQLLWTPSTVGLYAMAFEVSDGVDRSPLDFIMQVLVNCNQQPFFIPATPPQPRFYKNIESSFTFVTATNVAGVTTAATWTIIPNAASINVISATSNGAYVTYQFKWSPSVSDVSSSVCIAAYDSNGLYNCNNYCVPLTIYNAAIIYASGIIRDFSKTGPNRDFSVTPTPTTNDYPSKKFVKSILGSDGLAQFDTTVTPFTTSKATFDQWWQTIPGVNQQSVYSRVLSDLLGNGVYTWNNTAWYPIDGLMYGNEGDAHNYFFTWEVHTYITFNRSHTYTFWSSDDLWVFFDNELPTGWNLQGIRNNGSVASFTVPMNGAQWANRVDGQTYDCDIFYANRGKNSIPGLQLQLPGANLCNALSVGQLLFSYKASGSISLSTFNTYSFITTGTGIQLMSTKTAPTVPVSTPVAVWVANKVGSVNVAQQIRVLQGFEVNFEFMVDNSMVAPYTKAGSNGFAFVMQSENAQDAGGPGYSIGYGLMTHSVAIEFDMNVDNTSACCFDKPYQHVALHTAYNGTNSANASALQAVSNNDPVLTMSNGTWHSVKIQYIPARQGSTGVKLGWVRVFMGTYLANGYSNIISPILEVPLSSDLLSDTFGGFAYVGLTSATSQTLGSSITFRSWNMTLVTVAPDQSTIAGDTTFMAGTVGSLLVQTRDACGNNLLVGEDANLFNVTVMKYFPSGNGLVTTLPISPKVTTNHDGTYSIALTTTIARNIGVYVSYMGVPLSNSPWFMNVYPGPTSPPNSSFVASDPLLPVSYDNSLLTVTDGVFVALINTDGTVKSTQMFDITTFVAATFTSYVSSGSTGPIAVAVKGSTTAAIRSTMQTAFPQATMLGAAYNNNAMSYALVTRPAGLNAGTTTSYECLLLADECTISASFGGSGSTFLFNVNLTSAGDNSGTTRAAIYVSDVIPTYTVGQAAYLSVIARDRYGNLNYNGDLFIVALSPTPVPALNNPTSAGNTYSQAYYTTSWSTYVANDYQFYIRLNADDGPLVAYTPRQVSILAAAPSHLTSTAVGTGRSSAVAGQAATLDVYLQDIYNNRLVVAPAAGVVTVTIKTGSSPITVLPAQMVWMSTGTAPSVYWFFRVTYTATIAGNWPLNVTILENGVRYQINDVLGQLVNVVPGPVSAAMSLISASSNLNGALDAGTPGTFICYAAQTCSVYVQAKDAYGNPRIGLNGDAPTSVPADPDFTITVTGNTGSSTNVVYLNAGLYQINIISNIATTATARILLSTTTVFTTTQNGFAAQPNLGYTMNVQPGPAAAPSYLITTSTAAPATSPYAAGPAFFATAGQPAFFTLVAFDKVNNNRTACADTTNAFVVSIQKSSSVFATTQPLFCLSKNQYRVNFTATTAAANYALQVSTVSDGASLYRRGTSTQGTVTVLPAATSPITSVPPTGPGTTGAQKGVRTVFYIQAKDIFGNNQDDWLDPFTATCVINYNGNNVPVQVSPAAAPNYGQYIANFTIPDDGNSLTNTYNLTVYLGGVKIWTKGPIGTTSLITYRYFQSVSTPTLALLPNAAATGSTPLYTAWIRHVDPAGAVLTDIISATGQMVLASSNAISDIGVTLLPWSQVPVGQQLADSQTASLYQVSFSAELAGLYYLELTAEGFTAKVALPSGTQIPYFNLSIVPGPLNGPSSIVSGLPNYNAIAGQPQSATAILKDQYGNTISSGGYVVNVSSTSGVALTSASKGTLSSSIWTAGYTANVATTYDVVVTANGITLGGQGSFTLVVSPGAPYGPTSTINTPPTATAGHPVSATVSVVDMYRNVIDNSNLVLNVTFSTATIGTITYVGQGVFDVSYTPTLAGTFPLVVTLPGGSQVGSTPYLVSVDPDDWATVSVVTNPSSIAGQPLLITLYVVDQFGNGWSNKSNKFRLEATDPSSVTGPTTSVPTPGQSYGTMTFTLPGSYTSLAGTYSWKITINGVANPRTSQIPTSFASSTVNPAAIEGSQTGVPDLSTQIYVVGTWIEANLTLNDMYGNQVLGGFNPANAILRFWNGPDACTVTDDAVVFLANTSFSPDPTAPWSGSYFHDLGGGIVSIRFRTTIPSVYTVEFGYGTVPNYHYVDCNVLDRLQFTMVPGPAYAPTSTWGPLPTTAVAGSPFSIAIHLNDQYGNPTNARSNADLTIAVTQSSSNALSTFNATGNVFEIGQYVSWITLYKVGSNTIDMKLIGASIPTPLPVPVTPGPLAKFVYHTSSVSVAATPSTFYITGTDAWGNPVDVGGYNFQVNFEVSPDQSTSAASSAALRATNPTAVSTAISNCEFASSCYDIVPTLSATDNTTVGGTVLPAWFGQYQVTITLTTSAGTTTQIVNTYINQSTCMYETGLPYRCLNGQCVSAYSKCTGSAAYSCTGTMCAASGSCTTTGACACPAGSTMCTGGYCAPTGTCPLFQGCPSGQVGCKANGVATGQCRMSLADCPSPSVCTPGYSLCADGQTCALSNANCPPLPSCPSTQVTCADGKCVSYLTDCPTPVTCPNSGVICPDGSCQASASKCPDVSACFDPTPLRCADGSCRAQWSDCPSGVVCPQGYVLCTSRQCAQHVTLCSNITTCPLTTVRCPDGSCAEASLLCPSLITCPPTLPVLCADHSCAVSEYDCAQPSSLNSCPSTMRVCPNGACISSPNGVNWPDCPTTTTCPLTSPVLCEDGSCVETVVNCSTNRPSCPSALPVRCPDGSCQGNLLDCPSLSVCPPAKPIRCIDGQCATANDLCPETIPSCDVGMIRCPGGECAPVLSLCSTHITCPSYMERCSDGTCRSITGTTGCSTVVPIDCPDGTIACPQAGLGTTCATTLANCPQSPVCPPTTPVRCVDNTCADTVSNCPVPTTDFGTKVACPDGTWGTSSSCTTAVTCPVDAPYKCFDQTCRLNPLDCPTPKSCPAGQFLCANGACTATLDATDCGSFGPCPASAPIRCASGDCVLSLEWCASLVVTLETSPCPFVGTVRCRDGSCMLPAQCVAASALCPVEAPLACADGMCVADLKTCNDPTTGCPYYAPRRCRTGQCIPTTGTCGANPDCPASADTLCPDGSCAATSAACPFATGCTGSQVRCFDGSCVATASGCTAGYDAQGMGNRCPSTTPYRCSSGFCALTSSACPAISSYLCTNSTRPIPCADGSCVATAVQCPVLRACDPILEDRCPGDGSCVDKNSTGTKCSVFQVCAPGVRCLETGICVKQASQCPDPTTGCPTGMNRCLDGSCSATVCSVQSQAGNGCPSNSSIKCTNGACVADLTSCPYPNGCQYGSPFRCTQNKACVSNLNQCASQAACGPGNVPSGKVLCPDNTCASSYSACTATNGCPMTAPIRCGNGDCKAYPSTAAVSALLKCAVLVTCPTGKVKCADQSCVDQLSFCPPVMTCPSGQVQCSNLQCVNSSALCSLASACPSTSGAACPNGLCTSDPSNCGFTTPYSTSTVPVPGSATDTYTQVQFQCSDGFMANDTKTCVTRAQAVRGASCPNIGEVVCWDGSCATAALCPITPSCAPGTYRCEDGSCRPLLTNCPAHTDCTPGTVHCPDGQCRASCLPYDGCGVNFYQCPNRECATSPAGCDSAQWRVSTGLSTDTTIGRRLLVPSSSGTERCTSNCYAQYKAYNLQYTVAVSQETSLTIGKDSNNVAIAVLTFPTGSVITPGSDSTIFTVNPVGDSEMRFAQNSLVPSRISQFGTSGFTYVDTLLSAAFMCNLGASAIQPFPVPITYTAYLDVQGLQYSVTSGQDVCLAYLFAIPQLDYARWDCVVTNRTARIAFPAMVGNKGISSFYDCGEPTTGKIYGFIHSPLRLNVVQPPKEPSWLARNALAVTLVLLAVGIIGLLCIYCAKRLHRYRRKYKDEKDAVNIKREEVDEMEQFGGQAGAKDDEVMMTSNPLTLQLKDMQQALADKEANLEAEKLKGEQSEARKDHIDQLKSDRNKMLSELETLRKELENQQKAQELARPKAAAVEEPPLTTSGPSSPTGPASSPAGYQPTTVQPKAYQAKPKKKDF